MKTFLVHIVGEGEGCDYTIGCNHAVEFVQAESLEEAKDKWWEYFQDNHFVDEDYSADDIKEVFEGSTHSIPESACFYEVVDIKGSTFDFNQKYKELWAEAMKREQEEEEAAARKQYEELKVRFGN